MQGSGFKRQGFQSLIISNIKMTPEEFLETTLKIDTNFSYVLYFITSCIATRYLGMLEERSEKRNCATIAFLVAILVYAGSTILLFYSLQ